MSAGVERQPTNAEVWRVAAAVLLGPLMTQLDSTVVNLSLSTIQHDLHAPIATVQWVISGYLLALALALPISGWLVDRVGAKRLYLYCFSTFTLSSVLCGLSPNINVLIWSRVLQGVSGGFLTPMTQMMIARVAGNRMAKVMSYSAMPVLLAPLLGPVLAGFILKHAAWPWLFYINLPIGILAVWLAFVLLPDDESATVMRSFDFRGFALLSPGLVAILYGLEKASLLYGQVALLAGLCLVAGFVVYARNRQAALLDIHLFKIKMFATSSVAMFLHSGMTFAGQMLIPLYLIAGCKLAPASAGTYLAVMGTGMLCSYPFVGTLTERFGPRRVSVSGVLLLTLSTLPILLTAARGFSAPALIISLFVRGVGQGAVGIPALSSGYAAVTAVAKDKLPQATTASNIVQRLGGPVATTVMAMILSYSAARFPAGDASMYVLPFGALVLLQLVALCWVMQLPSKVQYG